MWLVFVVNATAAAGQYHVYFPCIGNSNEDYKDNAMKGIGDLLNRQANGMGILHLHLHLIWFCRILLRCWTLCG